MRAMHINATGSLRGMPLPKPPRPFGPGLMLLPRRANADSTSGGSRPVISSHNCLASVNSPAWFSFKPKMYRSFVLPHREVCGGCSSSQAAAPTLWPARCASPSSPDGGRAARQTPHTLRPDLQPLRAFLSCFVRARHACAPTPRCHGFGASVAHSSVASPVRSQAPVPRLTVDDAPKPRQRSPWCSSQAMCPLNRRRSTSYATRGR